MSDNGIAAMAHDLGELARHMLAAYDTGSAGRFFGQSVGLSVEQAYAVQAKTVRLRELRGERVIGYKVGCTSRAVQEQLSVKEPIFGQLFDTGCHRSGARLPSSRFANLAVEGEMAVRLSKDLPCKPLSVSEVRDAIDEVFPVIELHHYLLPAGWPSGAWVIASNGMHAGVVFPQPGSSFSGALDAAHSLRIQINEIVVGSVEEPASLVSPVDSLRGLSGRLARFGLSLCKDQVILTGSPMNLFPVAPDSRIVVEAPPLGACCVEIDP
jgi:2-keto-4-pentenoate hydratase